MARLSAIVAFLDRLCPSELAESWDNVGLLVGDPDVEMARAMTCLTITSQTVAEAIDQRVQLVVAHHPLPFRPLSRLTMATAEGRYLLKLIGAGVAIYSPHTAFDSAAEGINQRLATGLGLREIVPLLPRETLSPGTGSGRVGTTETGTTLATLADRAKRFLRLSTLQIVGSPERRLSRIAVACGSAAELLGPARDALCDCLVTGEARFHACLEAEAGGMAMILTGHFASERFAVEELSGVLAEHFADLTVHASRTERDPLSWM